MNEILELKNEITEKKHQISKRGNIQTPNCNIENFKFQIFLLQQENIFIKSELDKEQQIFEKLINFNRNQSLD